MSVPTVQPVITTVSAGAVRLGARRWPGTAGWPVLLVHGLSSNARLWDLVGARLAADGHPVLAVDLRGHGSSHAVPDDGGDATLAAAADLAAVCDGEGLAPVVAGQSWGGNVVLQFAADRPDLVHGLVLVDGGWLHLGDRFDDIEDAWKQLAPPALTGLPCDELRYRLTTAHPDWVDEAIEATLGNFALLPGGTVRPWLDRARHRAIVASLLAHRPRDLYPRVHCRTVLLAASAGDALVDEAMAALPDATLQEFPDGDHDLHAQHPHPVADAIGRHT